MKHITASRMWCNPRTMERYYYSLGIHLLNEIIYLTLHYACIRVVELLTEADRRCFPFLVDLCVTRSPLKTLDGSGKDAPILEHRAYSIKRVFFQLIMAQAKNTGRHKVPVPSRCSVVTAVDCVSSLEDLDST